MTAGRAGSRGGFPGEDGETRSRGFTYQSMWPRPHFSLLTSPESMGRTGRTETPGPTVRGRRRKERPIWWAGLALSVVAHLLVVLLGPSGSVPVAPGAAAGPGRGSPEAATGGMQALNIRAPTAEITTPPPPTPVPSLEAVEPVALEDEASIDASSILGERPGLEEPGAEIGTGQGAGGTEEEGSRRLVPPSPRGMIVPPNHEELRGREISVWVFVDETGRVVPDSTRLEPPTRDRDLNERLVDEAAEWVFEPAREDGEPVAAWFPYTIRM